jgi:processive 1,2-diacylglycerol beta-glucosyltransferase
MVFNCADVVDRILAAGEYGEYNLKKFKIPCMPLDSFEKAKRIFENDISLKVYLICYGKVIGSNALYYYSHFPLSLKQPLRSIGYILTNYSKNKLEKSVNYYVKNYYEDKIDFERLRKINFSIKTKKLLNSKNIIKNVKFKMHIHKINVLKIDMLDFLKRV